MYRTWCKAHVIPEKLTVKIENNGRQHPLKLKLLLVLRFLATDSTVSGHLQQNIIWLQKKF